MGGMHGHINHLYEDRDISFRELKNIISNLGSGKVDAHEKIDGINLYITMDPHSENIRVARNKSHIKSGGLDANGIKGQFANRPKLMASLLEAYEALSKAFEAVDGESKYGIFGSSGGVWVSCDVVDPNISNTIEYGGKHIVFHKEGTKLFSFDGSPLIFNLDKNINTLQNKIPAMNESLLNMEWNLSGPIPIPLRPMDTIEIDKYKRQIDEIAQRARIPIGDSIQNYLFKRLKDEMQRFVSIHHVIKEFIIKRQLGFPNMPTINKICNGLDESVKEQIKMMVDDCDKTIYKLMIPIENVVHDFSKKLLSGMKSSLVDNAGSELERLKQETSRCMGVIRNSGDQKGMSMLSNQVYKLNSLDEIDTVIEGIVFPHGQKTFKVTGIFAPMNRICGYVKYKKPQDVEVSKPSLAQFIKSG